MMAKVYKGRYTNSGDQIFTVENGNVYKGRYTNSGDQIFTVENGNVYKGRYTNSGDQIMKIEGPVTLAEFAAIWYAYTYLW